jgi:hypothetical protein
MYKGVLNRQVTPSDGGAGSPCRARARDHAESGGGLLPVVQRVALGACTRIIQPRRDNATASPRFPNRSAFGAMHR